MTGQPFGQVQLRKAREELEGRLVRRSTFKPVQDVCWELIDQLPDGAGVLDCGSLGDGQVGVIKRPVKGMAGFSKTFRIDGLDADACNRQATYHDLSEVRGEYELIVASHGPECASGDDAYTFRKLALIGKTLTVIMPNGSPGSGAALDHDGLDFCVFLELSGWRCRGLVHAGWPSGLRWYAKLFRLWDAASRQRSPYANLVIVAERAEWVVGRGERV